MFDEKSDFQILEMPSPQGPAGAQTAHEIYVEQGRLWGGSILADHKGENTRVNGVRRALNQAIFRQKPPPNRIVVKFRPGPPSGLEELGKAVGLVQLARLAREGPPYTL